MLNKLLKNDNDNGSGNIQLLCKLWSGESASYHFVTESTPEIDGNTPFSILGATQIQNTTSLIYRMDKGHGLLNRFIISVPLAVKPTPESEEAVTEKHSASGACAMVSGLSGSGPGNTCKERSSRHLVMLCSMKNV